MALEKWQPGWVPPARDEVPAGFCGRRERSGLPAGHSLPVVGQPYEAHAYQNVSAFFPVSVPFFLLLMPPVLVKGSSDADLSSEGKIQIVPVRLLYLY